METAVVNNTAALTTFRELGAAEVSSMLSWHLYENFSTGNESLPPRPGSLIVRDRNMKIYRRQVCLFCKGFVVIGVFTARGRERM